MAYTGDREQDRRYELRALLALEILKVLGLMLDGWMGWCGRAAHDLPFEELLDLLDELVGHGG